MYLITPVMQRYYNDCVPASLATASHTSYSRIMQIIRKDSLNPTIPSSEPLILAQLPHIRYEVAETFHAPGIYLITAPDRKSVV